MNSSTSIFFDTGAILAFFNTSEQLVSEAISNHIEPYPHSARLMVTPSLVELFYKLRKMVSPKDIQSGLAAYSIELFSEGSAFEKKVFNDYCKITYKNGFDYADYFLCRTALLFPTSQIITVDMNDFPNAYGAAYNDRDYKSHKNVQIIPIGLSTL